MKKLLLSLPLVMSLVACSDKEDTRVINGISQEITVDASTRMMYGNKALKTGTTFDVGDQISVYVAAGSMDNVEMGTLQVNNSINTLGDDGKWSADPKMLWKDRTTKHYFLGVYPQRQIQDLYAENYTFDIADQEASDLLVATNLDGLTCTATPVPLNFHHVMSRLDVYLKFVDFGSVPANVAVKVDLYDDASVNLATREVTPSTTKQEYTLPVYPVLRDGYDLGYRSIAVPCNDLDKVTVEVDGQTFVYTPKNPALLAAGMTTSFMLTVSQSGISISDVNIVDWDSGEVIEDEISEGGNKETHGFENGHEWVDLGLSVKWATMNVGANAPQEYGSYIAWGETETATKSSYDWSTYKFRPDFIGDNKITLDPEDDAAHVNWGGDWVMPSSGDFDELQQYCTYNWTSQNGVNGCKITGSNGNYIFLPAAGIRSSGSGNVGLYGCYWSSSLDEDSSDRGRCLYFDDGNFDPWDDSYRFYGQSVRPVCPSAGNVNGRVAVDLGLPSGKLWADYNVGADAPESYGDYLAWGETEAKEKYDNSNYKHMQEGNPQDVYSVYNFVKKYQAPDDQCGGMWYRFAKYSHDDNKRTIENTDDAAHVNWGDSWRIPTQVELWELYNNTTKTWIDNYEGTGVKGCVFASTKDGYEGVSIFLPGAGAGYFDEIRHEGFFGFYWSSSLSNSFLDYAYYLQVSSSGIGLGGWLPRYYGFSVRPVCPAE